MFEAYQKIINNCLNGFLSDPLTVGISIGFFLISLFCVKRVQRQNLSSTYKGALLYIHFFTFLFPLQYFFFTITCKALGDCAITTTLQYTFYGTFLITTFFALAIIPLVYVYYHKPALVQNKHISSFILHVAQRYQMKTPTLYVLQVSKPLAFSLSLLHKSIFFSMGIADILTRKELEAVLLHELAHVKEGTSFLKSALFLTRFSPFLSFATARRELSAEEKRADAFARSIQGTTQYLLSAKKKINAYHAASRRLR